MREIYEKILFGSLTFACVFGLAACDSAEKPIVETTTDISKGSLTYIYNEIPALNMMDSFSYGDEKESPLHIIKKKAVFNLEPIMEDFGKDFYHESTYIGSSYKNADPGYYSGENYSTLKYYKNDWSKKKYFNDSIFEKMLDNPSRYYTSEVLADLALVENDKMTADEFKNIYGDRIADVFDYRYYYESIVKVTDHRFVYDLDVLKGVCSFYGLDDSKKDEEYAKEYADFLDVEITVYSTVSLKSYEDYSSYRAWDIPTDEKYAYLVSSGCSWYKIPNEFPHAREVLKLY